MVFLYLGLKSFLSFWLDLPYLKPYVSERAFFVRNLDNLLKSMLEMSFQFILNNFLKRERFLSIKLFSFNWTNLWGFVALSSLWIIKFLFIIRLISLIFFCTWINDWKRSKLILLFTNFWKNNLNLFERMSKWVLIESWIVFNSLMSKISLSNLISSKIKLWKFLIVVLYASRFNSLKSTFALDKSCFK